jgi:hypothetical protein
LDGGVGGVGEEGAADGAEDVADPHGEASCFSGRPLLPDPESGWLLDAMRCDAGFCCACAG